MMSMNELEKFLNDWTEDSYGVKPWCVSLIKYAKGISGLKMEYNGRPGVSHSVRLINPAQKDRPFFAMIDIIDDDPAERWLSICFYAELINDPEEKGDLIPAGLNDKDAICFDVEDPENFSGYIEKRISEGFTTII